MRAKFSSLTCDCVKIDLNNNVPGKQLEELRGEVNRFLNSLQNIVSAANQLEKIIRDAEQATIYEIKAVESAKSDLTSARNSTPRTETITEVAKSDVYGNVEKRTTTRPINSELISSYNKQIEQCEHDIKAKQAFLETLHNAGADCSRVIGELGGYISDVERWQSRLSDCENVMSDECRKIMNAIKSAEISMRRYAAVYPEVFPYNRIKHISEN